MVESVVQVLPEGRRTHLTVGKMGVTPPSWSQVTGAHSVGHLGRQVPGGRQPVPPTLVGAWPWCRVTRMPVFRRPRRETPGQSAYLGERPGSTTWLRGKREGLGSRKLPVESLGVEEAPLSA